LTAAANLKTLNADWNIVVYWNIIVEVVDTHNLVVDTEERQLNTIDCSNVVISKLVVIASRESR